MHCHHMFKTLQISRCIQTSIFPKAWSQSFISHSRIWSGHSLHSQPVLRKDAVALHSQAETGKIKQLMKRVGWLDISRSKLKASGYILYECSTDKVNHIKFFEEFQMDDTFFSWFLITELHVWMVMVRLMAAGSEGRFVRNSMIEAMWKDVSSRSKQLDPANPSIVRESIGELSEQFQAALVGYDEGLLSDDKVLAAALWRRFFQQDCEDPEYVERLVHYIRKQVKILDEMREDDVMLRPDITWIDIPEVGVS